MDYVTQLQTIVNYWIRCEWVRDMNWTKHLTETIIAYAPSQRAELLKNHSSARYYGRALLDRHSGKFNLTLTADGTASYRHWYKERVYGSESDYYSGNRRTVSNDMKGTWT